LRRQEKELRGWVAEYERQGRQAGGKIGAQRKGGKEEGSGEDVFRALGERYADVEKEIDEVKKDIERLETKVWRGR